MFPFNKDQNPAEDDFGACIVHEFPSLSWKKLNLVGTYLAYLGTFVSEKKISTKFVKA